MSEYPSNWKVKTFCDLVTLKRGVDLPVQQREEGEIPIYGSNGIIGFHTGSTQDHPGVVTGRSGSIGNVYLHKTPFWALNTTLYSEKTHGNDIEYIYHFLNWFDLSRFSGGTGVPTLNRNDVHDQVIGIPPLPEQKKIAEILTGIDKIIASLDLQKTKYEQLFASILSKVFTELQEANRVCRIGDICEVKRGASPRPIQSKEWWGRGRGWTRISDVTKSKKYLYATKDRLSPAGEQKSVPIDPGSIILSICATIGLPVIPKLPVCIHDGFVWFDGIEKELLPEFAYYFFLSVREGLLSGRQTGTQGNLNTSIVSQQLIPVPTQNEQRRIIKILSEMEFQGEKIDRKIQSHSHLKSSISADLLSGRKRVSV